MLIEQMLNEKIDDKDKKKYTVRVNVSTGGNLPNRASFVRNVYRQTSLLEFVDEEMRNVQPLDKEYDVYYTLSLKSIKEENIVSTFKLLEEDLLKYLNYKR